MYPKFCIIFSQFYPTHSRLVYDQIETILPILYREVPHMLPAKYQPNPPGGSGEEDFWRVFTIFGHGGHLEFRIKTILAIFLFPQCLNAKWNLVTFGPVVSEEKSFESVDGRRTEDGGFPYYKLPRSQRLRGAKKQDLSWDRIAHLTALTQAAIDKT